MLLGLFKSIGAPCWIILKDSTFGGFEVRFSKENILGAGGYGMVYHGNLINGTLVDINKFLNNLCQLEFEFKIFVPEKEFQVEVEAIGHVRHKNLVSLLGYCIEGMHMYFPIWQSLIVLYLFWHLKMLCSKASPQDVGLRVCQQWKFGTVTSWSHATPHVSHLEG
ncbi:hypothetical protein KY290_037458 [Solanum tuberosum]|uniref:non-specific serine/threonine protein kinase n=1 Tax=Solanum tuberosum TaxID=4113 RepID=A0ABQ7TXI0_SOLTU|nr:hypothetical protein KY290_037458 [Solanum tuberosum]